MATLKQVLLAMDQDARDDFFRLVRRFLMCTDEVREEVADCIVEMLCPAPAEIVFDVDDAEGGE
jgi:hypothetical protein